MFVGDEIYKVYPGCGTKVFKCVRSELLRVVHPKVFYMNSGKWFLYLSMMASVFGKTILQVGSSETSRWLSDASMSTK